MFAALRRPSRSSWPCTLPQPILSHYRGARTQHARSHIGSRTALLYPADPPVGRHRRRRAPPAEAPRRGAAPSCGRSSRSARGCGHSSARPRAKRSKIGSVHTSPATLSLRSGDPSVIRGYSLSTLACMEPVLQVLFRIEYLTLYFPIYNIPRST